VTGDRNDSPAAGTPPAVAEAAAWTCSKPLASSRAVLESSALTGNVSLPRWTYHRSLVLMTLILRSAPSPYDRWAITSVFD
jgi:hypothetical protein